MSETLFICETASDLTRTEVSREPQDGWVVFKQGPDVIVLPPTLALELGRTLVDVLGASNGT